MLSSSVCILSDASGDEALVLGHHHTVGIQVIDKDVAARRVTRGGTAQSASPFLFDQNCRYYNATNTLPDILLLSLIVARERERELDIFLFYVLILVLIPYQVRRAAISGFQPKHCNTFAFLRSGHNSDNPKVVLLHFEISSAIQVIRKATERPH